MLPSYEVRTLVVQEEKRTYGKKYIYEDELV